jgi:hypothetical protein
MLVGKREEKRSLQTRDPIAAKRLHVEAMVEIEGGWANLRAGPKSLTEREAHQMAMVVHDGWLRQHTDNLSQQTAWKVALGSRVFVAAPVPENIEVLLDDPSSWEVDKDWPRIG